jgi:hypothetical protein
MKRSSQFAISAVAVAVIVSPVLAFLFLDRIVPVLGPVLPRYEGIPSSASANYSLKEGLFWTWKRRANSGCISWMAVEEWASVQVFVNRTCEVVNETGLSGGKGLTFLSFQDHLVFRNYWAWSPEIYDKLIVFDDQGMVRDVLPCPSSLTQTQIAELRATTLGALANRLTEAEKRVLSSIAERLTHVDGNALSSSQSGCSDWHDSEDARQQVDPWTGG